MACSTRSGNTYLNSLVPFPGATGDGASYLINLTHYTCSGRRICSMEAFPVTADLAYKVRGIEQVGDGLYNVDILATGTCTYKPTCSNCPVAEPVYAYLSVPVASAELPSVTAGECVCSLNGISCNCNTSSSIDITAAFTVSSGEAA